MKNKMAVLIGVAALVLATATLNAQTNADTNGIPPLTPAQTMALLKGTNSPSPLGQIEHGVSDGYNILKSDSFTNGFNETADILYHSGEWGFVDAVTTDSTNSLNYGFFIGGITEKSSTTNKVSSFNLFDGGITISANGNYTIPVAGTVNLQAETGAVLDLSDITAGAFNEDTGTGYKELFQTSDGNITVGVNGGIGYSTLFKDGKPFYIAGLTLTDRLKGKGFLGLW